MLVQLALCFKKIFLKQLRTIAIRASASCIPVHTLKIIIKERTFRSDSIVPQLLCSPKCRYPGTVQPKEVWATFFCEGLHIVDRYIRFILARVPFGKWQIKQGGETHTIHLLLRTTTHRLRQSDGYMSVTTLKAFPRSEDIFCSHMEVRLHKIFRQYECERWEWLCFVACMLFSVGSSCKSLCLLCWSLWKGR